MKTPLQQILWELEYSLLNLDVDLDVYNASIYGETDTNRANELGIIRNGLMDKKKMLQKKLEILNERYANPTKKTK